MRNLALILSAVLLMAAADSPRKVDGTWKWSFTMADGNKVEPKVKLKQDGETLNGISSFRPGSAVAIEDGKIEDDQVSWIIVREQNGRRVTTRYKGKIRGDSIKGTIESDWTGEVRSYAWEARRLADTPDGKWKWETGFGNFRSDNTATLKLEGQKVTGKVKSRDREVDVKDGKFAAGEISFRVVRERDGNEFVSQYRGKLDGDTMEGTVETEFGGNPRTNTWIATRVDE